MYDFKLETSNILSKIQKHGPLTKNQLLELTNYTLTSLNRFMIPLIDSNLISIVGNNDSSGGRPSKLFDVNKNEISVIGIDISRTYCTIVLTNMKMEVIEDVSVSIERNLDSIDLLEWMVNNIKQFQNEYKNILGIGIGIVGPVELETGVLLEPKFFPNQSYNNTNFFDEIKKRIELPVVIDSGSRSALRYEHLFGDAFGFTNTAFINWGVTLRDSVLINGHPISKGLAYENKLAHMIVDAGGLKCHCGKHGCVDAYSSLEGISKQIIVNYQEILDKISAQDTSQDDTINNAVEILSIGIANYVNLFDLNHLIISGPIPLSSDYIYNDLIIKIKSLIARDIIFSRGGSNPALSISLGAACHFVEEYFFKDLN